MKTRNPVIHWTDKEDLAVAQKILTMVSGYHMLKTGNEGLDLINKAQLVLPENRRKVKLYNNASTRCVMDLAKELWPDYVQNKVKEIQENDEETLHQSEKEMFPSTVKEEVQQRTMEDICRDIIREEINNNFNINSFMNMFMLAIEHPQYGVAIRREIKDLLFEGPYSAPRKDAVPVCVVAGVLPDQQNHLTDYFKDRVTFRFVKSSATRVPDLGNVDFGFVLTKFVGHHISTEMMKQLGKKCDYHKGMVSSLIPEISMKLSKWKGGAV